MFKLKYIFYILLITIILFGLFYYQNFDNKLKIYVLDVGQGDSILIKTPNKQNILIDGGPDNKVLAQLGKQMSFYERNIDILILTHPHSDHVVGLNEILKRYQIKSIYITGVIHTSPDYLEFLKLIKEKNIVFVDQKFNIDLGEELALNVLYPFYDFKNKKVENLNNTSIVCQLEYKDFKTLLMGDAEIEVEEDLIRNNIDLESDILKIGHHGSSTSSSQEFLETVNPKIAVISVGQDNKFNHPSLRTINRLKKMGIEIFRTDYLGTIIIKSDGKDFEIVNK